jgi:hypothetical protein
MPSEEGSKAQIAGIWCPYALAGEWAAIFSMWRFASWFLVALCLSSWFLSNRLARYDDAVSRFSPREDNRFNY